MTTHTELLTETRKRLISSLRDPQTSSAQFLEALTQAEQRLTDLMVEFQQDSDKSVLIPDSVNWSADYFSRHLLLAQNSNFARERIEHLLNVREHLRQLGVKGFVPLPPSLRDPQKESARNMASSFIPSASLKKFVAEGDLLSIRTALHMELNNNRLTRTDLQAALVWAKAQVSGLFEIYAEGSFARGMTSDQRFWISQYYDTQGVYLTTNFSEERLLHLIEVREQLRQQGVDGFVALPPKQSASIRQNTPAPVHAEHAVSSRHIAEHNSLIGELFDKTLECVEILRKRFRGSRDKSR